MATEIEQAFQELLYGEGALLGFLLIMSVIFLGSWRNKYLSLFFVPLSILLGVFYIDNVAGNSDLTWLALLSFLAIPFLVLRVVKGK